MASREELLIIRAARAGNASAQLSLGKRYLFGSTSLPKNLPTALYWLDRAARQNEPDAWLLIGSHVPFEIVRQSVQPSKLYVWYERAFDAGVAQAGLVLAKLVLGQVNGAVSDEMRNKALRALHAAAHAGIAEAQWMLAQSMSETSAGSSVHWSADTEGADNHAMLEWATRAANSGVEEAQSALAEHAWTSGNDAEFLRWALPLARQIVDHGQSVGFEGQAEQGTGLLLRCAHALMRSAQVDAGDVTRLLDFAAHTGNREAQFALGLWLARIDRSGERLPAAPGPANYKKAIRWLSLSAEQGSADAMYALSKIYMRPECSQRNVADALRYLEMAAQAGHGIAQLEQGLTSWRSRHDKESGDVDAVWWLQKAHAQGIAEAAHLLQKIAPRTEQGQWAQAALRHLPRNAFNAHPLLVARLEAAAALGLSRTEALLIDWSKADRGHCVIVDVRTQHPHTRRRLIPIQSASERQMLDRIVTLFSRIDCGPNGPEGNYRQRLYRLKILAPDAG